MRNPVRSRGFIPYDLYGKNFFLKCANIALVKQKSSGLENTRKNNCIPSQIKKGFSLKLGSKKPLV